MSDNIRHYSNTHANQSNHTTTTSNIKPPHAATHDDSDIVFDDGICALLGDLARACCRMPGLSMTYDAVVHISSLAVDASTLDGMYLNAAKRFVDALMSTRSADMSLLAMVILSQRRTDSIWDHVNDELEADPSNQIERSEIKKSTIFSKSYFCSLLARFVYRRMAIITTIAKHKSSAIRLEVIRFVADISARDHDFRQSIFDDETVVVNIVDIAGSLASSSESMFSSLDIIREVLKFSPSEFRYKVIEQVMPMIEYKAAPLIVAYRSLDNRRPEETQRPPDVELLNKRDNQLAFSLYWLWTCRTQEGIARELMQRCADSLYSYLDVEPAGFGCSLFYRLRPNLLYLISVVCLMEKKQINIGKFMKEFYYSTDSEDKENYYFDEVFFRHASIFSESLKTECLANGLNGYFLQLKIKRVIDGCKFENGRYGKTGWLRNNLINHVIRYFINYSSFYRYLTADQFACIYELVVSQRDDRAVMDADESRLVHLMIVHSQKDKMPSDYMISGVEKYTKILDIENVTQKQFVKRAKIVFEFRDREGSGILKRIIDRDIENELNEKPCTENILKIIQFRRKSPIIPDDDPYEYLYNDIYHARSLFDCHYCISDHCRDYHFDTRNQRFMKARYNKFINYGYSVHSTSGIRFELINWQTSYDDRKSGIVALVGNGMPYTQIKMVNIVTKKCLKVISTAHGQYLSAYIIRANGRPAIVGQHSSHARYAIDNDKSISVMYIHSGHTRLFDMPSKHWHQAIGCRDAFMISRPEGMYRYDTEKDDECVIRTSMFGIVGNRIYIFERYLVSLSKYYTPSRNSDDIGIEYLIISDTKTKQHFNIELNMTTLFKLESDSNLTIKPLDENSISQLHLDSHHHQVNIDTPLLLLGTADGHRVILRHRLCDTSDRAYACVDVCALMRDVSDAICRVDN